jgi:2-amino-4-hydroxy-6-hydroxymethyldihydropteridine diphosphokinase
MNHKCFLSIGSNYNAEYTIPEACSMLKSVLSDIHFSRCMYTKPIGLLSDKTFVNIVAMGKSLLSADETIAQLKRIEYTLGRKPEETKNGCIRIDIDLVQFDNCILKEQDAQRNYYRDGLQELLSKSH